MFFDTHAHLFYEDFNNDIDEVIQRAIDSGVRYFVVPGTNIETSRKAIELSEKFPTLYAAVGFHPLDLETYAEEKLSEIEILAKHPKVVAIGEIGIDYFYNYSPREMQKNVFRKQIELAIKLNLPIIVHTRDSVSDAIEIVVDYALYFNEWRSGNKKGVFHCFTGTYEDFQRLNNSGFMVSYPGPVTFKKSAMTDTVKAIGYQNIMLETDSPYLTPAPHRGKRNEPSNVPIIAQKISEICGAPIEEVARTTTENAFSFFNINRNTV